MRGTQKDGLQTLEDSIPIQLSSTDARGKHQVPWFLTQHFVCKHKMLITKGDQMRGLL